MAGRGMMEALHFIRPLWLLAFIPLIIILLVLYRHRGSSAIWKTVCDAKLLPYILSQSHHKSSRLPLLFAALGVGLAIIAAAGPAFEKLPQPVYREQSSLVVLLDLSQSMDAGDVKPSRIERAKLKLLDILDARRAGQTALIVYAADAFTVTPLTDDSNTIANLVPTLETALMPSQGSHAYTAIEKALQLLKQAGAGSGDVLLITDDINERDRQAIEKLSAQGYRLSVMGVGTEAGSPVSLRGGFLQDSTGAIVIPKLDQQKLQQAALEGGGLYVQLQTRDADINTLNKLFTSKNISDNENVSGAETERTADIWQEEGPWLLLLVIPLVALWARKGWLLSFAVLMLPIVPDPAYALDADQLWRNPDQQAMQLFNAGDAAGAAEKFQQNDWKAAAYYRAENYQQALEALQNPNSSDDYYNRGNALTKLGRLPEALEAYEKALNLDADNEDAQYNREQVKKAIEQQQQKQSGEGESSEDSEDSQQDKDGEQSSKDQQSDQQGDQQSQNDQDQSSENAENAENSESESRQDSDAENQQSKNSEQNEQDSASQNNTDDESIEQPAQSEQDQNKVEEALDDAQKKQAKNVEEATGEEEQPLPQTSQLDEAGLSEDEQAIEQWLKRVPNNPEQLLRRKFLYQYKNMEQKTPSEQSW
ncbi:MAG: VWA domain-containing protein [Gammaproteobacteria bacterium]|nr:VWA domain-containing protein [Gammaproteobacteria bacterium]